MADIVASNVGKLIEALSKLNPSATVHSTEPPFDSVKLVPQNDGSVLICRGREPDQIRAMSLEQALRQ